MAGEKESQKPVEDATKSTKNKPSAQPTVPTPSQYTQSPLTIVFVGPKRKKFEIYKDLLVAKSGFFRGALKDEWSYKDEVYLDKEDPKAFIVLVDWLFQDILTFSRSKYFPYTKYAAAYRLADFLVMPKAKNDIIDSVLNYLVTKKTAPNFLGLKLLCERFKGEIDNPLFKLCMLFSTHFFMRSKLEGLHDGISAYPVALVAVLDAINKWHDKPWEKPELKDRCDWHDHSDGKAEIERWREWGAIIAAPDMGCSGSRGPEAKPEIIIIEPQAT